MAAEWADNKEIKKDEEVQMTFGDALEKYIQNGPLSSHRPASESTRVCNVIAWYRSKSIS